MRWHQCIDVGVCVGIQVYVCVDIDDFYDGNDVGVCVGIGALMSEFALAFMLMFALTLMTFTLAFIGNCIGIGVPSVSLSALNGNVH